MLEGDPDDPIPPSREKKSALKGNKPNPGDRLLSLARTLAAVVLLLACRVRPLSALLLLRRDDLV